MSGVFAGNSASAGGGAIFNGSLFPLTVTNCTFSGNSAGGGGAIVNNGGRVSVTNSTFFGNSASDAGGAIVNGGTLTVTNSTFSDNSAGGAFAGGGAISNNVNGTATVTNSTFSGNSARSGEGGAIFNSSLLPGPLTVTNSILANSTAGGNCASSFGTIADGGNNIDDSTTCGFTGAGCASTTGTSFCNTNPLLDPAGLARNGGPTQTIALEAGSPAINAGNGTACAAPPVNNLDQRGFVRPGMGATNCSIGAYEFNAAPAPIFTENFDSYPLGAFPSSGGWQLLYDGLGPSYQYVGNTQFVSPPQALHLVGSSCFSGTAYHPVALPSQLTLE